MTVTHWTVPNSVVSSRAGYNNFSTAGKRDGQLRGDLTVAARRRGREQGWRWRRCRDNVALFQMRPHVAALAEAQAAFVARVRFDTRMVIHVRLQVMFLGERLTAQGAGVRLDA